MKKPTVHPDAFVAFNATVRGDVRIEEGAIPVLCFKIYPAFYPHGFGGF